MNITELPNPTTNLAFLPPQDAHDVEMGRYIIVGTLGALVWDILGNIVWDIKLVYRNRIRLPIICYFISRICSFGQILASAIYETAPVGQCHTWLRATAVLYGLSIGSTTFLFFLRLSALFIQDRYIVAFFFIMWIAVLGMNFSTVGAVSNANIGPTNFCVQTSVKEYAFLAGVVSLINDTLAYIAITVRLASQSYSDGHRARTVIFGESLPRFSKMFFKDSQLYFLITVAFNFVTVALAYTTSLSGTYRTMFTSINVMVSNSMACSLFRKLRFNLAANTPSDITGVAASYKNHAITQSIPLALRPDHSVAMEINATPKLSDHQGENFVSSRKCSEV